MTKLDRTRARTTDEILAEFTRIFEGTDEEPPETPAVPPDQDTPLPTIENAK